MSDEVNIKQQLTSFQGRLIVWVIFGWKSRNIQSTK